MPAIPRCIDAYIDAYIHACIHACIHVYIPACMHTYISALIIVHGVRAIVYIRCTCYTHYNLLCR